MSVLLGKTTIVLGTWSYPTNRGSDVRTDYQLTAEVDLDKLVRLVAAKAVYSKKGRTQVGHGAVVVKAVRR